MLSRGSSNIHFPIKCRDLHIGCIYIYYIQVGRFFGGLGKSVGKDRRLDDFAKIYKEIVEPPAFSQG